MHNQVLYNHERKTSTLFYRDEGASRELSLFGGVCWPTEVDRDGRKDIQGFAVLCGMDVETRVIDVLEQREFLCIEHVLREDGTIAVEGIAPWFTLCWSRYYGRSFYWNQPDETNKRYLLEVLRARMADPKPYFVSIGWADFADAQHVLWLAVKMQRLVLDKDSELGRQLQRAKTGDRAMLPAVHALVCALSGNERYPWRVRKPIQ